MKSRSSASIMVVDDDEIIRRLVVRVLRSSGFRVLEADCGESGLKVFREAQGPIQVVITDVLMPKMTGPGMVRRILEIDPDVPIIFITGTAGGDHEESCCWREQSRPSSPFW
jgi:two-component system cell cycle sensor histidine kinase/response regulator CckA